MKRDFTHENFEDFLKRSADSLRMKAPDKVWQNLSGELNKRRRRTAIGLSIFLLISAAVGYSVIYTAPANDNMATTVKQTINSTSLPKAGHKASPSSEPQKLASTRTEETRTRPSGAKSKNILFSQPFNTEILAVNDQPASTEMTGTGSVDMRIPEEPFTPTVVDSYTEFDAAPTESEKKDNNDNTIAPATYPLTIESVTNSFKTRSGKGKFETQIYFTPTISYRKLSENKSYLRNLDPSVIPSNYPALYSSVNSNVTHKPDVGFEFGFAAKYAVSKRLKVKIGAQFNVNRYDIKAFSSPLSNATIALNNGGRIDSFNTTSGYSTSIANGYKSNWLQNLSFQASIPIGVEYLFSGNDKLQFGIATTIQPTYVLNDRAYLITTDYKNYTQVDWLTRRWNVNTALETFVKYKSWQIGPQVRYQLLSSFISKYPVKENLFDFGLKVGVSLGK